jgi:Protein of unknown function (DUF6044)
MRLPGNRGHFLWAFLVDGGANWMVLTVFFALKLKDGKVVISMMDRWTKETKYIILASALLAIYLAPMFIFGEDSHIRLHDNLDSNIAWYKVLKDNQQLFGPIDDTIAQIINGLPRNAFGTEFSGIQWLHYFLPSMTAYAISQVIVRVFAFLGMYLLLKKHFLKAQEYGFIRVFAALAFSLTPFWPSGMLSTLGHPLALYAFLNIRNRDSSFKDWLILTLLPFYSSFVLGFFFFLAAIGLLWLYDGVIRKVWNGRFLGAILYMTSLYLLIEYRLVYSLVFPGEPNSRDEYFSAYLSFAQSVRLIFKNYVVGHTHVLTLHQFIILPLSFLALWFIFRDKRWKSEKTFLFLFVLNFVLSAWYAFWFYEGWDYLKERISLLNAFNFARFHFLRPLVLYLLFALSCRLMWKAGMKWRQLAKIAMIAQLFILFMGNPEVYYGKRGTPSFKEFYAEEQFNAIDDFIGRPKDSYRVASIGLHPAISQFNGFYTLDTYNNYYPLSYKHRFREIIDAELDKNKRLKNYFDNWGGRCYIFVDELGKKYDYGKNSKKKIRELELNTEVFKEMGGEYLFSSVPILNASANGLELLEVFDHEDSAWRIYLYHAV